MKKPFLPLSHLWALGLIVLLSGCGSITSSQTGLNVVASASRQSATSVLFRVGVENTGPEIKKLEFRSSQFFDIELRTLAGTVVWSYSHNAVFADLVWGLELTPGKSEVRDFVWDLTGNDGKTVLPGVYRAKIFITNTPRDERLTFEIGLTI